MRYFDCLLVAALPVPVVFWADFLLQRASDFVYYYTVEMSVRLC